MEPKGIDLKALRAYRQARLRRELEARDVAGIVLFDPINIRYATDTSNMQVWTLHNPVRCVFVATEGPVVLYEFLSCAHLSAGYETVDEIRRPLAWFYAIAGPRTEEMAGRWAAEIADLVRAHGGGNRRLAVDRLDPTGAAALASQGISVHDGQPATEHARAIKSAEEIVAMRAAIAACEDGMRAMREALRPGIREVELWSVLHQHNIASGGEWIETRLLSSGPRTNPWYQECSDRLIAAGDLVAFDTDLIGRYGYCADISRTWRTGDGVPDDEQRRLYRLAYERLQQSLELLKPGVGFREYSLANGILPEPYRSQRYDCLAHGVGLAEEYPALYWAEDFADYGFDGRFEENMTVSVESYIGAEGGREGVKLEEQALITAEGAELLSRYPFEEDWL